MRNRIWAELCDVRYKGYSLSFIVSKFQKRDRNINIFLAIVSSGSIAAWVVWDNNSLIWGGIIAVSQVLTVIKPYFPYLKYIKELKMRSIKIDFINIELEKLWYKMESGKTSEEQAADIYFDLQKEIAEILNFGDDTVFDIDKKTRQRANERMKIYLKNNYGIHININ